jgi:hypothetical protein
MLGKSDYRITTSSRMNRAEGDIKSGQFGRKGNTEE